MGRPVASQKAQREKLEREALAKAKEQLRQEGIDQASAVQSTQGHITDRQVEDALSDKDQGVADLTALLRGQEWDDWVDRYLPMIDEEAQNIVTGVNIEKAVAQADSSVTQSFDNARRGMALSNERLGIEQSATQQNQQERSMGLSEVAQRVDKVNDARVSATDRDRAIVAGGMNGSINTAQDDG